MNKPYFSFLKRIPLTQRILIGIAIALAAPAYVSVRDLVVCWSITELPGASPASCKNAAGVKEPHFGTSQLRSSPESPADPPVEVAPPEASLPSWDGASRVNLLFIGLDERDWVAGAGAPRSDTLMLFTIDPVSKTAGMLSIPRDLWVNIPGLGHNKINTAYAFGEARRMPGGGPGLAAETVEHFIGVPVHYYAQVDFHAFEEAIDALGGLYLCPQERITIDPIGPKPPVKIGPECRKYWGYEVLGYVRNRKTSGGDIDRANRQQKVILALMDQVFSPQKFPEMVSKAPEIYLEARSGLRTNLGFDRALKLGYLLSQVPVDNIEYGVIDYSMAFLDSVILNNGQKASILKPYPDQIRVLRDEIFSAAGPLSPMASGDPLALMLEDEARVRVVNGTATDGLSEQVGSYLQGKGMQVVEMGGKSERRYERTTIVMFGPKLYTLEYLVETFGIDRRNQILFREDPAFTADIEIRVGTDALDIIH